jgi:hypothetical protein
MKAYKLMRLRRDDTLGSLFINRSEVYSIGEWMEAKFYPTNGFAQRYGWHCCRNECASSQIKTCKRRTKSMGGV